MSRVGTFHGGKFPCLRVATEKDFHLKRALSAQDSNCHPGPGNTGPRDWNIRNHVLQQGVLQMKSVRKLALALAVGGLAVTTAWADDGAAPGLLPLPELSNRWSSAQAYPVAPSTTSNVPPAAAQPIAYIQPRSNETAPPQPPPPLAKPRDVFDSLGAPAGCTECAENNACASSAIGCCLPTWYGYAGGLVMTRNQPNKYWTTYDQANNNAQIMNTAEAKVHGAGGAEFTIGYRICCEESIEATYWGLWDMSGACSITSATNNLGTPMDTTNGAGGLLLGGQTPDSFFTNAHQMLIWRNDQANNVEVNWAYNPWGADSSSCIRTTWLTGFRFFNFNENLLWTSVAGGFTYGSNGGANEANLDVRTENTLYGFQIGNRVDWQVTDRFSIFGTPKMGIYGNHAQSESTYYRGDGIQNFDITGSKNLVSFLGQFDLGMKYDINDHWSATAGYRVVVATGIALSDSQIPAFLAAAGDFAEVKTNNDLVLHGVFAGISCNW